jgi:hypothetical protein
MGFHLKWVKINPCNLCHNLTFTKWKLCEIQYNEHNCTFFLFLICFIEEILRCANIWCHWIVSCVGANEISWATLAPLVIPYWVFVLEYSLNILNNFFKKNLETSWKFSSHNYVMVYIKTLLNIMSFSLKFKFIYKFFLLFKNISYNVFKVFLGVFHSLDWFQTFRVYISIHWNNIM